MTIQSWRWRTRPEDVESSDETGLFTEIAARAEHLNLSGRIGDVEKPQLAGLAAKHDPSRDPHGLPRRAGRLRAQFANVADCLVLVEALSVGVVAECDDLFELVDARLFETVGLLG